ncbi:ABC transporter permease [Actinomadura rudentiformis]|uniref:ABC transporter permease n=1 Tax=Actinomadura rudentiformis TaxID=359158 RepID=A0A6H9YAN6_9ACTN|nr:ABC transporter permease [Actinomadura rudentiformis]KAB2339983.1 ABC transporter permease [Actinomadura rudentiformis]
MHLVATHAKYQFLETARIPIAVIGNVFFPVAVMVFFVVPFTRDDPAEATQAAASVVTFALMMSFLFQYGVGVAEDRAQPWDAYTRTLPAGPWPRFAGRILCGFAFMAMSLLSVVIVAAVATPATLSPGELAATLGALVVAAVPFVLLGLAIGYSLPGKAALALTQIVFFPLAFGGGLLGPPGEAPEFVETVAPYLPTRGAVELVWAAVGDYRINPTAMVMLGVWIAATGALAVWAYRRDEGRRFT